MIAAPNCIHGTALDAPCPSCIGFRAIPVVKSVPLQDVPADQLAAELNERGWLCLPPVADHIEPRRAA